MMKKEGVKVPSRGVGAGIYRTAIKKWKTQQGLA
jgi:hypothetical protein